MNNKVNPLVGGVIIAVIAIIICVLLYKHNFKPTEDTPQTMSAADQAKIKAMYGTRPPSRPGQGRPGGARPGPGHP